ncbi:unnamed protein product [Rhizophagus irregularis]|uniref:BTB-domain-containing protein n=1 Tax=Rhizophagus irregularis TaxID=588596 RepID=A0A2I1H1V3_9GLOM|nr:BTB-domain-containing protein [Rhizophagus irregularis]CAB4410442.1 unnamed protein product [Rhizophagus irregularis]
MLSDFLPCLSKNLLNLLQDADDYNVSIQVGENEDIKEFRAHSNILRARSPYFKIALSSDWVKKENGIIVFIKPNISPTVFEIILRYIYAGILDLDRFIGEDILDLLVAADELLLEELIYHVQIHLIQKQSRWVQKNMVEVLHTVFKLVTCKKMQDYCLEKICEDPTTFFTLKNFTTLDSDIFYLLLSRDDLQIEEVLVWDYLIKWGTYQKKLLESEYDDYQSEQSEQSEPENQQQQQQQQEQEQEQHQHHHHHHQKQRHQKNCSINSTSSVSSDASTTSLSSSPTSNIPTTNVLTTKWNEKNFKALKRILGKFIPLIRFFEISWRDFFDQVRPYKPIIPQEIYEDIMAFHMNDVKPKMCTLFPRLGHIPIESNIVKPIHAAIISNWIERKDTKSFVSTNESHLNFKLLYRGSRDGFNNREFRYKCNNRGPSVAIIKLKSSGKIIGGYNPFGWQYNTTAWKKTSDSFIFSLENGENFHKIKLSRVNIPVAAIYEHQSSGLNFGGGDLNMDNHIVSCQKKMQSYEYSILDNDAYSAEEFEVFSTSMNYV